MRRLFRILLNAATVLSLVLWVATVGLWVRSYWRADRWMTEWQGPRNLALAANRGTFYLICSAVDADHNSELQFGFSLPPGFSTAAATKEDDDVSSGFSSFLGFKWLLVELGPMTVLTCGVPAWSVAVVSSTLPLFALRRIRRRRRQADRGLCSACGYDLRATPDRCPECGSIPTAAAASVVPKRGTPPIDANGR